MSNIMPVMTLNGRGRINESGSNESSYNESSYAGRLLKAAGPGYGGDKGMKIRDIDTVLIDSPGRKWTLVRVFTDAGLVGLGEATYSKKETVVAAAIEHLKAELVGEDPARIEYLWHKLYRVSSDCGIWRMAGPVWMSALAGIDIALWDLKGKVAGLPLYEILGGVFRDRVELYTHFHGNTPEESAASARRGVDAGFTALKSGSRSSCGYDFDPYREDGDPTATAAHFSAVRQAVGPQVKLLVDCHGRFTVAAAVKLARALEPLDLYAFEDPVPPEDLRLYSEVRRQITIPVMGSERLNTKSHFRQLLEMGGVDIAQPDLMYAGGITEVRKIAAIADTYQVPLSLHNTKGPVGIVAAAHLMTAIPNAAPLEYVSDIAWRDEILTRPLRVEGGFLRLDQGPGLGIELDMDGVERHRWRP
jgi:galactonate dehydratase